MKHDKIKKPPRIEKVEEFQDFFKEKVFKDHHAESQEGQEIIKSRKGMVDSNNKGKLTVYCVDPHAPEGVILVLSDGSKWSPMGGFGLNQNHALNWHRGDSVSLRRSGGKIFILTNPVADETSRWIAQGYVENWGK